MGAMHWYDYLLLVISLALTLIIVLQNSKDDASSAFSGAKSEMAKQKQRGAEKEILPPYYIGAESGGLKEPLPHCQRGAHPVFLQKASRASQSFEPVSRGSAAFARLRSG